MTAGMVVPVREEARHAKERRTAGRCFGRGDAGTRSLAMILLLLTPLLGNGRGGICCCMSTRGTMGCGVFTSVAVVDVS